MKLQCLFRCVSGFLIGILLLSALVSCGLFVDPAGTENLPEPSDTETQSPKDGQLTPDPVPPAVHTVDQLKGLIFSQVYGTGNNPDAPVRFSYIQLYNPTLRDIPLSGASVYHRKGDSGYVSEFGFPEGARVMAGHYYLVRCAEATGKDGTAYDLTCEVMQVRQFDAECRELRLDNQENLLILGESGLQFNSPNALPYSRNPYVATYFIGTAAEETPDMRDIHIAYGMSKNKIAVKTDNLPNAYYQVRNLTKLGTFDLRRFRPRTSEGDVNTYTESRLPEVVFSEDPGFYDHALSLELSGPENSVIYYTLDGTEPTVKSKVYTGPIQLEDSSDVPNGEMTRRSVQYVGPAPLTDSFPGLRVVKAMAVSGDTQTGVTTASYLIIPGFSADYHVKVFSLTLPIRNWNSAIGIYNRYNTSDPRPRSDAYLEIFNEDGDRVSHANIEVSVSGKYSASKNMKSLRLYFKGRLNDTNEGENSVYSALFGEYALDSEGAVISEYQRLLLRNGGNDCGYSYIRDAFSQRLGGLLGVDHMAYTPAILFVNGEFWGVYNCRERYETQYATNHYGVLPENVTVMESDYSKVNRDNMADYVVSDGNAADGVNFNNLYHFIRDNDMKIEKNYRKVEQELDFDSLIDMYVEHLVLCGADWPHNNIKLWRNWNPDDPSGFDTKWHYALLDQDTTLALSFSYSQNCFENAFNDRSVTALIMIKLMENTEFRNRFFVRYYTAATQIYTPTRMTDLFYEIYDAVSPLIDLQERRWPGDFPGRDRWESEMNKILTFLQNRQSYALSTFYSFFSVTEAEILELMGGAS